MAKINLWDPRDYWGGICPAAYDNCKGALDGEGFKKGCSDPEFFHSDDCVCLPRHYAEKGEFVSPLNSTNERRWVERHAEA